MLLVDQSAWDPVYHQQMGCYAIRTEASDAASEPQLLVLEDVEALVRVYWSRVLRFAILSVGDPDLAATIAQDCFLKAHQTREQFRGDCSIATWLTKIAYHLICDYTRLERFKFWKRVSNTAVDVGELAGVLASREPSAEQRLIGKQRLAAILQIVEHLPVQQRSVFMLHYIEEFSVAEISEVLGMQRATVKTHLYRATAKLRAGFGVQS